jgi:hypothetical protein
MPQPSGALPTPRCWWDVARGLGVCGDFFGGTGVEGAWQSARALSDAMRPVVARATSRAESPVADVHLPRAA